jgi:hypothetical protein
MNIELHIDCAKDLKTKSSIAGRQNIAQIKNKRVGGINCFHSNLAPRAVIAWFVVHIDLNFAQAATKQ